MKKAPRKPPTVKLSEDARVTPASREAATDDGDGGRILEELATVARAAREGKRPAAESLAFLRRHAEPEPLPVAASCGAPRAVCEVTPSKGGPVPEGTQGGPPGGATVFSERHPTRVLSREDFDLAMLAEFERRRVGARRGASTHAGWALLAFFILLGLALSVLVR